MAFICVLSLRPAQVPRLKHLGGLGQALAFFCVAPGWLRLGYLSAGGFRGQMDICVDWHTGLSSS
jgi:hypothetical protein